MHNLSKPIYILTIYNTSPSFDGTTYIKSCAFKKEKIYVRSRKKISAFVCPTRLTPTVRAYNTNTWLTSTAHETNHIRSKYRIDINYQILKRHITLLKRFTQHKFCNNAAFNRTFTSKRSTEQETITRPEKQRHNM